MPLKFRPVGSGSHWSQNIFLQSVSLSRTPQWRRLGCITFSYIGMLTSPGYLSHLPGHMVEAEARGSVSALQQYLRCFPGAGFSAS